MIFFPLCIVFLDAQVVDDEFLTVGSVLPHVVLEYLVEIGILAQGNPFQSNIIADEIAELRGRDLSQALEARDLGFPLELLDRRLLQIGRASCRERV